LLQNGEVQRALVVLCALGLLASTAAPAAADRWYAPAPVLGIVDAGRQATAARQAGASWDRALFLWQVIQPDRASDWKLDTYVDQFKLQPTFSSGLPVVGVVQGTPGWAAVDPSKGAAGVPSGLDLPIDDPRNVFGQFMTRLVRTYKGRITTWVIWNEPDFLPSESPAWWTWAGDANDFAKLMKTGYRAVKSVDPSATVVFPATTYFADAVNARELFLSRVLKALNTDSQSPPNNYFFDAVGVNLYCSLDAVYRVHGVYASILAQYQLDKPLWLTETNCPIYNDATTPQPAAGRITTDEQSAYLLEAVALARAAGYQRIGWYSMVDHDASTEIFDRWGLLRVDGSTRPAYRAFQVASRYLALPDVSVRLAPLGDATADGWAVTRVIVDDPGGHTRVQVLWRTAAGPATVDVQASGTTASLVDPQGYLATPRQTNAGWEVPLPPARVPELTDPPGFQSSGYPVLLVESGVSGASVVLPPNVTSPLMALSPSLVAPPQALDQVARPQPAAAPATGANGQVGPAAAMPAITQPGPTLVLSVANPQPNDLLPRGKYVMEGLAFDRAASSGSGVDRVSVFVDDRDTGGQHVGDAELGKPGATGFTVTADLSRLGGGHTLFVYARSAVTGKEAVVSFPVAIGSR
jgi:hypothetical protein